jgi:nucleoside-diphosphate kinase
MEQTLVILKPDALQRGIAGEIITRFERIGLKIVAAKMVIATEELANKHYPTSRTEFIEGMGNKT